jgi:hypothetical protein
MVRFNSEYTSIHNKLAHLEGLVLGTHEKLNAIQQVTHQLRERKNDEQGQSTTVTPTVGSSSVPPWAEAAEAALRKHYGDGAIEQVQSRTNNDDPVVHVVNDYGCVEHRINDRRVDSAEIHDHRIAHYPYNHPNNCTCYLCTTDKQHRNSTNSGESESDNLVFNNLYASDHVQIYTSGRVSSEAPQSERRLWSSNLRDFYNACLDDYFQRIPFSGSSPTGATDWWKLSRLNGQ